MEMSTSATADTTESLKWADYVVIGLTLVISTIVGVYYRFTGGRQKTTEEYFSANRSMSIVPVSLALAVYFKSAISLLGTSSETYQYGTQILAFNLGYILGTPVSTYLYLPVFFKLQSITAFEYLEKRFGVAARLTASIANSVQLLLYTGVVLYAPALTLEATTGLPGDLSMILLGIICTFYSTIGGIKGVMMTDVFQSLLMFVAVIMIIVFAAINVDGGNAGIWRIAVDGNRIEFDNFSIDPTMRHTWWSLTLCGICIYVTRNGISQVQVQKLLTVRTLKEARSAMWISLLCTILLGLMIAFTGLSIYAYFKDCDPLTTGEITASDMLMPYFVMKTMGHIPGLPGLFIAGIASASLSTVSATVNSLAAVVLEDYMKPSYAKLGYDFPEKRQALVGKILAAVIGMLSLVVGFLAKNMGSLAQTSVSIAGAFGGPLLGIFTLGMFFESAEEKGAVFGTLVSLAIVCWSAFGQPRPSKIPLPVSTSGCNATLISSLPSSVRQVAVGDSSYFYLYRISYTWYAPVGILVSVIVGLTVSNLLRLVTRKTLPESNPDLFTPPIANRIIRRRLNAVKTLNNQQIFTSEPNKTAAG